MSIYHITEIGISTSGHRFSTRRVLRILSQFRMVQFDMKRGPKHICVVEHLHGYYARMILRGIAQFARERANWIIHAVGLTPDPSARIKRLKPDGIIGHIPSDMGAVHTLIDRMAVPFVALLEPPNVSVPHVRADDVLLGEIAAERFMNLGFRRFAYVGRRKAGFSDRRQEGFERALAKRDYTCEAMLLPFRTYPGFDIGNPSAPLQKWIKSVKPMTGLFASNDGTAIDVLAACRLTGRRVPEEVAVLGVDDDDLICLLARPELSSIRMPFERIGFLAAEMLDTLVAGKRLKKASQLIPPIGIVGRRSTDILAVSDPIVNQALTLIAEHIFEPININAILEKMLVSRTLLEKRFRECLGRTPLKELHRQKANLAAQLLVDTDQTVEQISERCGFPSGLRLTAGFRKQMGMPPTEYRRRMQRSAG